VRAEGTGQGECYQDGEERLRDSEAGRGEQDGEHRQERTEDERQCRSAGGLHSAGDVVGVDVQLRVQMGVQRAVSGRVGGDGAGRGGGQALCLVESRQLGQLGVRVDGELLLVLPDLRALAVALAGDRHVLTKRHRYGPAHEAGQSGREDGAAVRCGAGHPDDDARHGTIPSLAPRTPARSQFKRPTVLPECGSRGWVGRPLSAAST
jgi:hypothetical protein